MKRLTRPWVVTAVILAGLWACGRKPEAAPKAEAQPPAGGAAAAAPAATAAAATVPAAGEALVTAPDGKVLYRIAFGAEKCALKGAGDEVLGAIKGKSGKLKVYDGKDQMVVEIKSKDYGYKSYDATGKELRKFKKYEDGYFKLKEGEDTTICKIKPKSGRYEVTDGAGNLVFTLRTGDGWVFVEDKDGKGVVNVQGLSPLSAALIVQDKVALLERLGLAVAIRDMQ